MAGDDESPEDVRVEHRCVDSRVGEEAAGLVFEESEISIGGDDGEEDEEAVWPGFLPVVNQGLRDGEERSAVEPRVRRVEVVAEAVRRVDGGNTEHDA